MRPLLSKSIEIARKLHNPHSQLFNVYAFIYEKKRLLSVGHNDMVKPDNKTLYLGKKFNVEQFKNYPYRHAELDAISKLWGKKIITGRETLIVVRLLKNYSIACGKPCDDCMKIINALGIERLEWTT